MEGKYKTILGNIEQLNLEKESKETEIEVLQERLNDTENELNQTQTYLEELFTQYKDMNASYQELQRSNYQHQTSSILKENTPPLITTTKRHHLVSPKVTPRNLLQDITPMT
eukprot:CAMPEP_0117426480 /NCGR_PEP_ID=MMETSP0758-20121206/6583_1 /TAXON_ID=63605 /ORGANISM="Percolomonas cosmopolitus, Strain AE-1 (ATCC 50343)" /LENGTH=111 /DNA_ID=CAMNT_0005211669 /DNA_START=496 /DNA_END=834 /DNA_ORIENTATION=+